MISFWLTLAFGIVVQCSEPLIEHVDEKSGAVWRATERSFFKSEADFKRRLGSLPITPEDLNLLPMKKPEQFNKDDLPDNFDAREKWPQCEMIKFIWDQAHCGSCWAISAASVMSDRLCIHKDEHVQLSATDLLSCCPYCGEGCNGGRLPRTWIYYEYYGLVTGGDGPTCKGCFCYPFPRCRQRQSSDIYILTPACVKKCRKEYPKSFKEDKHFGDGGFRLGGGVDDIRKEIMTYGPLQVAFSVMEDFQYYHSGIYFHKWGRDAGGHAVRLIGWGKENGTAYWLVANSWCTSWGENGLFRIRRGTNECGIESYVFGGLPK